MAAATKMKMRRSCVRLVQHLAVATCLALCPGTAGWAEPLPVPVAPKKDPPVPQGANSIWPLPRVEEPTTPASTRSRAERNAAAASIYEVEFHSPWQTRIAAHANDELPVRLSDDEVTLKVATWCSPQPVHRTLYFDDELLERHGCSNHPCLQPAISMKRFATDACLLPVRLLTTPPRCIHPANPVRH